jgi:hypothetical protein
MGDHATRDPEELDEGEDYGSKVVVQEHTFQAIFASDRTKTIFLGGQASPALARKDREGWLFLAGGQKLL